MTPNHLDELVDTLLWEGHQLYPYTPSATKNATPTPFGIVYPAAHADGSPHRFARLKLQCIATRAAGPSATVHFLLDGQAHRVEVARGAEVTFTYGSVSGRATLEVEELAGVARVTVEVHNTTVVAAGLTRAAALGFSLLSTHVVVSCGAGGRFASPVAPPPELATAVLSCVNVNTHPVLATPQDDVILGAAIILPDHPQIAPESRGSLFDATEIEEALLLHVLALSDGEREELATADPAVRAMIERAVSATPADIMALHGRVTVRDPAPPGAPAAAPRPVPAAGAEAEIRGEQAVVVGGRRFCRGAHVVLRPAAGRSAQDHLLRGRSATIERIYVDYDDAIHLCVTVDDDPGQELMRDIGRYLYFKPDEVEELAP